MIKTGFPRHWSTLEKLIWLRGSGAIGGTTYETIVGNPVTFSAKAAPLKQLSVAFSPVQDLHGYDSPWPAGGGKNKADFPVSTSLPYSERLTTVFDAGEDITVSNLVLSFFLENASFSNGQGAICDFKKNDGTHQYRVGGVYGISEGQTYTGQYSHAESNITFRYLNVMLGADYIHFTSGKASVQLEMDTSTATPFAPYSNICPISGWDSLNVEQRGKNLCGGIQLANEIQAAIPTATIDTTAKTVSYPYNAQQTGDTLINLPWKENTRYTFILTVLNPSIARTNFRINYTDGSYDVIDLADANVKTTVGFVTDANKTIDKVIRAGQGGTTVIYYEESGVFEGIHTIDDFVPYSGRSISISFGSTVYSGTLDVLTGVVTVTQKVITMTGAANREGYGETFAGKAGATYADMFYTQLNCADVGVAYGQLTEDLVPLIKCSHAKTCVFRQEDLEGVGLAFTWFAVQSPNRLQTRLSWKLGQGVDTVAKANQFLANQYAAGTPVQYTLPLAEPQTIQLTPQEVSSLLGENNMWSNANQPITVEYRKN